MILPYSLITAKTSFTMLFIKVKKLSCADHRYLASFKSCFYMHMTSQAYNILPEYLKHDFPTACQKILVLVDQYLEYSKSSRFSGTTLVHVSKGHCIQFMQFKYFLHELKILINTTGVENLINMICQNLSDATMKYMYMLKIKLYFNVPCLQICFLIKTIHPTSKITKWSQQYP